jgi:hypothetical protein
VRAFCRAVGYFNSLDLNSDPFVAVEQAAMVLQVKTVTIRRLILRRKLP